MYNITYTIAYCFPLVVLHFSFDSFNFNHAAQNIQSDSEKSNTIILYNMSWVNTLVIHNFCNVVVDHSNN